MVDSSPIGMTPTHCNVLLVVSNRSATGKRLLPVATSAQTEQKNLRMSLPNSKIRQLADTT